LGKNGLQASQRRLFKGERFLAGGREGGWVKITEGVWGEHENLIELK